MKKTLQLISILIIFCSTVQSQIFHEDFEVVDSMVGNNNWSQTALYHTNGLYSNWGTYAAGDSAVMTSIAFSTLGTNSVFLNFDHIAKVEFFDGAIIEYSDDSVNWTQLFGGLEQPVPPPGANCFYYGLSPGFEAQGDKFIEASYNNWLAGQAVVPDSTWWHHEIFDISQLASQHSTNYIRFKLKDLNSTGLGNPARYGWLVDKIIVDDKFYQSSVWFHGDTCITPTIYDFSLNYKCSGYNPIDTAVFAFDFGDGSYDTVSFPINSIQNQIIYHMYSATGSYNASVIRIIPGVLTDTNFFQIIIGTGCDTINGRVYFDNNLDCIFNSGDSARTKHSILLKSGNGNYRYAQTDSLGFYQFIAPNSSYTIFNEIVHYGIAPICPSVDTIAITSVPSFNNDFAVNCNSTQDFNALTYHSNMSPGHLELCKIFYRNKSCQSILGQVKLVKGIGIDSFMYCGNCIISGDTAIWNRSFNFSFNFYNFFSDYTRIVFKIDSTLTTGDTICYQIILDPITTDSNPADNLISICDQLFLNPYDPNFKQVTPDGDITNNTELNYMIHFQNTGTGPAINIIVVDTFSNNVDLTTLQITGSSHTMNVSIDQNHVAQFIFPNINLPDSGTDFEASQGYIAYSIKTKSNLPAGAKIYNTANIYFDNNAPVATNTTENTIIIPLSVNEISSDKNLVSVYPNPFENNVVVKSHSSEKIKSVSVFEVSGKLLLKKEKVNSTEITLSLNFLSNGIYILKTEMFSGVYFLKLVK